MLVHVTYALELTHTHMPHTYAIPTLHTGQRLALCTINCSNAKLKTVHCEHFRNAVTEDISLSFPRHRRILETSSTVRLLPQNSGSAAARPTQQVSGTRAPDVGRAGARRAAKIASHRRAAGLVPTTARLSPTSRIETGHHCGASCD